MKNFSFFTILFLFFFKSFAEEIYFEDLENAKIKTNEQGEIVKINLAKPTYKLYLTNNVSVTENKKIKNWEDEILTGLIKEKPQKTHSSISHEIIIDSELQNSFFLVSAFSNFSSNYLEKKPQESNFSKYGISASQRMARLPDYSPYLGFRLARLKTFDFQSENYIKNKEFSFFYQVRFDRGKRYFADFKLGKKSLEKENQYFVEFYFKQNVTSDIAFAIDFEVSVADKFFGKKENKFERFGSYSGKTGLVGKLENNLDLSFLFGYEKNKKYGFERQEVVFSAKYKVI